VTDAVTSPTFMLVQQYAGRLPMIHVDVYRLEHLQEVIDLGLPEMLDDGAVAVIEWGEAAAPALAPDYLYIRISFGAADDDREFTVEPVGLSWAGRIAMVAAAVDQWVRR
jgi:tRNA threonylcarbamoyladenosine biosynthesis protein TsaE